MGDDNAVNSGRGGGPNPSRQSQQAVGRGGVGRYKVNRTHAQLVSERGLGQQVGGRPGRYAAATAIFEQADRPPGRNQDQSGLFCGPSHD